MVLASAWRWGVLLRAQHVRLPYSFLTQSFLVATFFNNFLPSNIGGDVVRITDTAEAAGSKTLATTVVLIDRGIGLLGLALMAATGASLMHRMAVGPVGPGMLWAGFGLGAMIATPALLMPETVGRLLAAAPGVPPGMGGRADRETHLRADAVQGNPRRAGRRASPAPWSSRGILVAFYVAIARSMHIPIGFAELAVIVPVSFIVQMIPLSVNGFGVREATFGFYFTRLGLPLESALLVSFVGAALIMLFSLTGGVAYLRRSVVS